MDQMLSTEDENTLKQLQDPDQQQITGDTYRWNEDFQREILGLMLNDRVFTLESRPLISPIYFTHDVHRKICEILFAHFDEYRFLPNRVQLVQELRDKLKEKKDDVIVAALTELNSVLEFYVPNVESRDYYRDKIVKFAKTQSLKMAFHKCMEKLKDAPDSDDTWSQIEQHLRDALTVDYNFDMGLDYFQDFEERYLRKEERIETGDVFTSGFPAIDNSLKNGGLLRGEIGSWMGLSGSGKSLSLVKAALENVNRGKKVLYITLEIDQDAVAERFDAQIANPVGQLEITTKNLTEHKEIVFESLKKYVADYDDPRMLVVKQFPSGTMDLPMFRSYFSQLNMRGFRPDLVILDYIGEMKDYPGMPVHESRFLIVRGLRGFAIEEQVCVFTAMQPNKSAKEAIRNGLLIDDENIGDSYAQVRPLDALWTLNQIQDEKDCSIARGYIAKHREGKSRFVFHIHFNYDTLAMRQISLENYSKIQKKYQMEKERTVTDAAAEEQHNMLYGKKKKANQPQAQEGTMPGMFSSEPEEDDGPDSPDEE